MKTGYIKFALWLVIFVLGYFLFQSVMGPIRFNKQKEIRYAAVISNLEGIRSAQMAYKSVNGSYSSDFDQLINFTDTGNFEIIERKDTSFLAYDKAYRTNLLKDSTITRVLGYVGIRDSLFRNVADLNAMRFIPGTTTEIQLGATRINSGGIEIPVFEAKADKLIVLKGLDGSLVKLEKDLKIGSLTEATVSGNWN
jgi:type II secretory pathway pseudopilin PulG